MNGFYRRAGEAAALTVGRAHAARHLSARLSLPTPDAGDTRAQFLEHGAAMLRFEAEWVELGAPFSDRRRFALQVCEEEEEAGDAARARARRRTLPPLSAPRCCSTTSRMTLSRCLTRRAPSRAAASSQSSCSASASPASPLTLPRPPASRPSGAARRAPSAAQASPRPTRPPCRPLQPLRARATRRRRAPRRAARRRTPSRARLRTARLAPWGAAPRPSRASPS